LETTFVQVVTESKAQCLVQFGGFSLKRIKVSQRRARIGINHRKLFGKGREPRSEGAVPAKDERVAVEYQLIIPPDRIAIDDRYMIGGCDGCQHLGAPLRFAEGKWRGAEIENEFRAGTNQSRNRGRAVKSAGKVLFRPNVFANGDAAADPGNFDHRWPESGLEIPVFIEHVVSREKR